MAGVGETDVPTVEQSEPTPPVLHKMCSDCLDLTPHYLLDGYCECVICGTRIYL
jgi:hypothetical protein